MKGNDEPTDWKDITEAAKRQEQLNEKWREAERRDKERARRKVRGVMEKKTHWWLVFPCFLGISVGLLYVLFRPETEAEKQSRLNTLHYLERGVKALELVRDNPALEDSPRIQRVLKEAKEARDRHPEWQSKKREQ
jgi:hypothetical protein